LIDIDISSSKTSLQKNLKGIGWLFDGEAIKSMESPGEGNMNVVMRVCTNKRSFILKQSRPYVRKYKEVAAPIDRIDVEYQFYRSIADPVAASCFPRILAYNPSHHLLQMEDLGECRDMTYWYSERKINQEVLDNLIDILTTIHIQVPPEDYPANLGMRTLNHQHIFVLPFMEDNGFLLDDVQKGLQALSIPFKQDRELKEIIAKTGEKYLRNGNTLLHGDYYPGSWMSGKQKLYVIDPEFSFPGFPEYDLGIMAAHTIMTTADRKYLDVILKGYKNQADQALTSRVAGIEIMRRLIGLAQLPLERNLEEKEYLLKTAREMVLQ
jgi:5-methylthioribose kinase